MRISPMPRLFSCLALASGIFLGGAAMAQAPGVTSGPESESGQPALPSTSVQKENPARPNIPPSQLQGSVEGSGAAGVEAKPGTEGGAVQRPPAQPRY